MIFRFMSTLKSDTRVYYLHNPRIIQLESPKMTFYIGDHVTIDSRYSTRLSDIFHKDDLFQKKFKR